MDYRTIQDVMLTIGLDADPAFDDLRISIEPIACTNGCPLGLYFPVGEWSPNLQHDMPAKSIVLPPDATEGALYHELGHRHGHYYYNDLSEKYAEDFRKRYQKGRALLYMGSDFGRLPKFGCLFEEGEKGAVEIALLQRLTPDELCEIKSQLYSYGEVPKIYYHNSEVPLVRVEFTKGVDWLMIIGATLGTLALATVGVIGYAVYKTAKDAPWITPIVMFGVVASFILGAAIRQERLKGRLVF